MAANSTAAYSTESARTVRSLSLSPSLLVNGTTTPTKQVECSAGRSARQIAETTLKGCTLRQAGAVYHISVKTLEIKENKTHSLPIESRNPFQGWLSIDL